jgi:hypothetical protein
MIPLFSRSARATVKAGSPAGNRLPKTPRQAHSVTSSLSPNAPEPHGQTVPRPPAGRAQKDTVPPSSPLHLPARLHYPDAPYRFPAGMPFNQPPRHHSPLNSGLLSVRVTHRAGKKRALTFDPPVGLRIAPGKKRALTFG